MPDQIRSDAAAALRVVGEEIAMRLMLAHCIADLARAAPDPKKYLKEAKVDLIGRAQKLDQLAGDASNVVPTVCMAVIASVFNSAGQRLA